jgi:hypothetical protein
VIFRTKLDRAAVVTTAIMQIVATAEASEQQQALEDCLRDEFTEVRREALAERERVDE